MGKSDGDETIAPLTHTEYTRSLHEHYIKIYYVCGLYVFTFWRHKENLNLTDVVSCTNHSEIVINILSE